MKRRPETENVKKNHQTGQAMREARCRLGWSQFDLGQRAGCSEVKISRIETGRTVPEPPLKEAIARELQIPTWEVGV